MSLSDLEVQSILSRIAPTTTQVSGVATIKDLRKKLAGATIKISRECNGSAGLPCWTDVQRFALIAFQHFMSLPIFILRH